MNKLELRKIYKEKRNHLSEDNIQALSSDLTKRLLDTFHFHHQTISLFLTIERQKEIDTSCILQELAPKNEIIVSKSDFTTSQLHLFHYENEQQLSLSPYGIPEPTYGKSCLATDLDVILVPMFCFDKDGYRVGYGKGFYDRLIHQTLDKCLLIGLCMFPPVKKIEDRNEYDQPLHYCVTPDEVYTFGKNR